MDASLTMEDGLLRLRWAPGVDIAEDAAEEAMARVNALCGENRHPMIVDMAAVRSVHPGARAVFGRSCAASRIALLGSSPVDKVIANFILGVSKVPCPTRFFTSEAQAEAWCRQTGPRGSQGAPGAASAGR
jgi:hypothetical protein